MYTKRKKSKSKKTNTTRRRRRMGATGGSVQIMEAVGLIGGAAIARVLTTTDKIAFLSNIDAKFKNAGVVAIGYFFPKLVKSPIGKSIGAGMITAGGLGLLQSTGVIGQMDEFMSIPISVMAGDDLSVIAGYSEDNMSVIAGMDEEDY
jgi:hypothetical protein